MFWIKGKKKVKEKPFGVCLSININTMSLAETARTSEPPTTQAMANVWLKGNCTRVSVGVAALNAVNNTVLFFLGSDGNIYRDMEFDIKLPFPIGPNKTDIVKVTPTDDFIFLSFDGIVVMAFPTPYIINSLIGEPLAEFGHAKKDLFGETEEIEINVASVSGQYKLPVIAKVAAEWFKYENTAIKVVSSLIVSNEAFPVSLEMSSE